jgi:hypothetical protein
VGVENVFFIPDTKIHVWLDKLGKHIPPGVALVTTGVLSHYMTQIGQWKYAKRIIKSKNIDVIHEPEPVSPKQPSMMFGLGVPVDYWANEWRHRFSASFSIHGREALKSFSQVVARLSKPCF